MATFSDLPVELHHRLARTCASQGHSVLAKYALLSRQHFHLARPLLHNSADLSHPTCGPESLSKFIYNFAPHHRTDLYRVSIAFRPSPSQCPYDELDESLSQILSLLGTISELEIKLETPNIEESFLLTIRTLACFTRIRSLTIRGQGELAPRVDLILNALPQLGTLHTLRLEGLTIVRPSWKRGASSVRALDIDNCVFSDPASEDIGSFIDLFGPTLTALRLRNLSKDQTITSFCCLQLTRLWLSLSKPVSSPTTRAKREGTVERPPKWLNVLAHAGPIRQLVLEDQLLFEAAPFFAFGHLEEVCRSASVVNFLGDA
eukprot:GHVU01014792.1.p1 GENE.GHVU01014792.1~~GHVU01014792.1.p1  ORF type:complete len:318 (+),score=11.32 GHVU01014792.1:134-1087(+)